LLEFDISLFTYDGLHGIKKNGRSSSFGVIKTATKDIMISWALITATHCIEQGNGLSLISNSAAVLLVIKMHHPFIAATIGHTPELDFILVLFWRATHEMF
jgi:hypothetical protein